MKTWIEGELITAEDLNTLEQAVANIDTKATATADELTQVKADATALAGVVDTLEQSVADVDAKADTTAAQVDQIKLANTSAGEGAPTGTAPVGWVYTDLATGDIYRMEA